jgi:hypothetical protein
MRQTQKTHPKGHVFHVRGIWRGPPSVGRLVVVGCLVGWAERTLPSRNSSEGGWRGCVDGEPLRLAIRAREGLVVACRQKKHPLRLAFRAREGWMGCVDKRNTPSVSRFEQGRGVLTENPSVSQFERGRGFEGMCRQITPPSRNLSEEGVGGDASTEETSPPSRVSSEGGGWRVSTEETPPLSRVSSERGGLRECDLSVSQFEQGRGWW